jgi:MmyB-like transcription regulator ligand binding domain
VKHFHHPVVGDLDLLFESADLVADPGWKLLIYTAEPRSPTADALRLLASWAATQEQERALFGTGAHSADVGPGDVNSRPAVTPAAAGVDGRMNA